MIRTKQLLKLAKPINPIKSRGFSGKNNFSSNVFTSVGIKTNEWGHNVKYLNSIELTINNPNTQYWWESSRVYEANLYLKKEDIRLTKTFWSNDFVQLTNDINKFMQNEIKI